MGGAFSLVVILAAAAGSCGVLLTSSHNSSSSVQSIVFEMQHFLNDFTMVGTLTSSQDSLTHCACVVKGGALMFPPAVKVYSSAAIHCIQRSHNPSLNGLLMLTSNGCRMPVSPPGMTATSVLVALTVLMTLSVLMSHQDTLRDRDPLTTSSARHAAGTHPLPSQIKMRQPSGTLLEL